MLCDSQCVCKLKLFWILNFLNIYCSYIKFFHQIKFLIIFKVTFGVKLHINSSKKTVGFYCRTAWYAWVHFTIKIFQCLELLLPFFFPPFFLQKKSTFSTLHKTSKLLLKPLKIERLHHAFTILNYCTLKIRNFGLYLAFSWIKDISYIKQDIFLAKMVSS